MEHNKIIKTLKLHKLWLFDNKQGECAVIESDWPEYQFVWRLIEERVLRPDVSLFRIIQKLSKCNSYC